MNLMENSRNNLFKTPEELRKNTNGKHKIVNAKLKCINEILNNPTIHNKHELISQIQKNNSLIEIFKIVNKNNLNVIFSKEIQIEANKRYMYNSMLRNHLKWDNKSMINYFQRRAYRMYIPKKNAFSKINNWIREKFGINKKLLLHAGQEDKTEDKYAGSLQAKPPEEAEPSWSLSRWGMDKETIGQGVEYTDNDSRLENSGIDKITTGDDELDLDDDGR